MVYTLLLLNPDNLVEVILKWFQVVIFILLVFCSKHRKLKLVEDIDSEESISLYLCVM